MENDGLDEFREELPNEKKVEVYDSEIVKNTNKINNPKKESKSFFNNIDILSTILFTFVISAFTTEVIATMIRFVVGFTKDYYFPESFSWLIFIGLTVMIFISINNNYVEKPQIIDEFKKNY